MKDFNEMIAQIRREKSRLDAQLASVDTLKYAIEQLRKQGHEVTVSAGRGEVSFLCKFIGFEAGAQAVDAPAVMPAPEPEAVSPPEPELPPVPAPVAGAPTRPRLKRPAGGGTKLKSGDAWSEADTEKLIAGALNGKKATELSEELGRGKKAIENKLYRLRGEIERRRGADWPDVAQHVAGLLVTNDWTPEKDLKFARLIQKGAGVAGAGAVLKIDAEQARARWAAMSNGRDGQAAIDQLVEALSKRAGQ